MTHYSFEDRLAKLDANRQTGLTAGGFDQQGAKPDHRGAQFNNENDNDFDTVFWVAFAVVCILLTAGYSMAPTDVKPLFLLAIPVVVAVGGIKILLTIRRRGLSMARDGDNFVELMDGLASLVKLFR